jgi:hypothetical protein
MTVQELIDELAKQDPNAQIEFPLCTYTQVYPSVYVQSDPRITKAPGQNFGAGHSVVRIEVALPKGFTISERKAK